MVNFRKFETSSGKKVLVGKSAENNEELVDQVENEELVFHTESPGSPFCNIKEDKKKITKEDIKETATFCALHSQDWRDNQKDVTIHYFLGKDIYKLKSMKKGTFGVKNLKEIKIKREDIIKLKKDLEKNEKNTNS
jgi:predicted ribosome quality control (RQC) complex YloA/Tae2 family protein